MRRIGRLGYERHAHALLRPGWRRLFWRLWWFDPLEERRVLELHASWWGVEAHPLESTDQLRNRIVERSRSIRK